MKNQRNLHQQWNYVFAKKKKEREKVVERESDRTFDLISPQIDITKSGTNFLRMCLYLIAAMFVINSFIQDRRLSIGKTNRVTNQKCDSY